ncbi:MULTISPECIES: hypothetical protein [Sphingobium]|uniref:hypothetical protein n=1 Tax=Sphingobium TaxID=165695 RepID=UPI001BEBE964|nr:MULTISPECIES: hypothetical protein [Sphingobium]MBT2246353.1 hypothetical protein [Sphingobium sp. BHU LFT2]WBQ19244.1 hypothetical protein PAE53_22880 [Sphingobium yanoikuyae]
MIDQDDMQRSIGTMGLAGNRKALEQGMGPAWKLRLSKRRLASEPVDRLREAGNLVPIRRHHFH